MFCFSNIFEISGFPDYFKEKLVNLAKYLIYPFNFLPDTCLTYSDGTIQNPNPVYEKNV